MTALESRETNLTTAVEQRLLNEWNKRKDKTSSEVNGTMALRVSTNASIKNREDIVCFFCKEKEHFKPKCPKYKKYLKDKKEKGKDKRKSSDGKQQANLVETSEKSDFLFLTSRISHGWIVDSGHHMLHLIKACLQNLTRIISRRSSWRMVNEWQLRESVQYKFM